MAHVVDIHCHTFNADDLPVRGFLERVAFDDNDLAQNIAALVDVLIQGRARGTSTRCAAWTRCWRAEASGPARNPSEGLSRRRNRCSTSTPWPSGTSPTSRSPRRPSCAGSWSRCPCPVGGESPGLTGGPEGIRDAIAGAKRAIKWVRIFGMSRLGRHQPPRPCVRHGRGRPLHADARRPRYGALRLRRHHDASADGAAGEDQPTVHGRKCRGHHDGARAPVHRVRPATGRGTRGATATSRRRSTSWPSPWRSTASWA